MQFDKQRAFIYIRSDIENLAMQDQPNEIYSFVGRIRGQIGMLMTLQLISPQEAATLEDELIAAKKIASAKATR